jgi:hypothetical protein
MMLDVGARICNRLSLPPLPRRKYASRVCKRLRPILQANLIKGFVKLESYISKNHVSA